MIRISGIVSIWLGLWSLLELSHTHPYNLLFAATGGIAIGTGVRLLS